MCKDIGMKRDSKINPFHETKHGRMYCVDSLEFIRTEIDDGSVDLIMTSPPFGLVRKKTYGNVDAENYVTWFHPFGLAAARHTPLPPQLNQYLDLHGRSHRDYSVFFPFNAFFFARFYRFVSQILTQNLPRSSK